MLMYFYYKCQDNLFNSGLFWQAAVVFPNRKSEEEEQEILCLRIKTWEKYEIQYYYGLG